MSQQKKIVYVNWFNNIFLKIIFVFSTWNFEGIFYIALLFLPCAV